MLDEKVNLRECQHRLNEILRSHSIQGMREFIYANSNYFRAITEEQKTSDRWLYDLIHIYKANLVYLGDQFYESLQYCLDHKLIEISPEYAALIDAAKERKEEIQECFTIIPESEVEKPPQTS